MNKLFQLLLLVTVVGLGTTLGHAQGGGFAPDTPDVPRGYTKPHDKPSRRGAREAARLLEEIYGPKEEEPTATEENNTGESVAPSLPADARRNRTMNPAPPAFDEDEAARMERERADEAARMERERADSLRREREARARIERERAAVARREREARARREREAIERKEKIEREARERKERAARESKEKTARSSKEKASDRKEKDSARTGKNSRADKKQRESEAKNTKKDSNRKEKSSERDAKTKKLMLRRAELFLEFDKFIIRCLEARQV